MRVHYLAALCTLPLALLGVAPPASAATPECPCWDDGQIGLAILVGDVNLAICTNHPVSEGLGAGVLAGIFGASPAGAAVLASWSDRDGDGVRDQFCQVRNWPGTLMDEFFDDATAPEVHACIRDITAVCRALGFSGP